MQIDLINPLTPPAHWNFSGAMDLVGARFSHPALGLATLAAHAPAGVDVRLWDENVQDVDLTRLGDTVGLSAMFIQRKRTFELARALRKLGKRVLIGGAIAHAVPHECERHADVIFRGEAELTWPEFLADLGRGAPKALYHTDKKFDLKLAKVPAFDKLHMMRYSTASLQTSRGCPFSCDYCDVPMLDGPGVRVKTVEQVLAEAEALYRTGQRSFFIVDDNFIGNRRFALQVLKALATWVAGHKHKPIFYCQATLNVAQDKELLEALYQANFRRLFIGIESSEVDALKKAKKPHNTLQPIADAVKAIQRHNITVWCALLLGFDEDKPETFARYRELAQGAGIGMVIPGLLQAVPGTAYHERMQSAGRLVALRTEYVGGQAGSLDTLPITNVAPVHMTRDELSTELRAFARDLYSYDAYAERLIRFLELGERPELGRFDLGDVWAAKGILARVFKHYVVDGDGESRRFITRVAKHLVKSRGRRLDEAVFHLVIYKHLREFYRQCAEATVPLADDILDGAAA
jgi:radical SAM superfamily enzyme YgiQ (UPF0313 family)